MYEGILKVINEKLNNRFLQYIIYKTLLTKDTCYEGKVLKIIATNHYKDVNTNTDVDIDIRYSREQAIAYIPIRTFDTLEEFNQYIDNQLTLAVQQINKMLTISD